ncbi:MAG: MBL fold metallo-hydrolase [Actinomycetota bacterium]|nr:MBL fold metallo-hydrolase [Actinomycetota bacterium]
MPRIAEGVHRLGSDLVNFYLVEDATGVTIVDAGLPRFYERLEAGLGEVGRKWEDIRALVLTHAHVDHVGFAERLRTEHGVPVHVHAEDAEMARTGKVPRPERLPFAYLRFPAAYRLIGHMLRNGAAKRQRVGDFSTFADGETLDVPGRPRVIHCPGHSRGCVALEFESHGALLVGDVLCSRNPLTGREGPQVPPAAFNVSSEQALASLSKLEPVEVAVVGFGHGDPWDGGVGAAVQRARARGKT